MGTLIDFTTASVRARNLAAALETQRGPVEASFREFRGDLQRFENPQRGAADRVVAAMVPWVAAMPELRYFGFSPCWNADCPACGAARDLWVTAAYLLEGRCEGDDGGGEWVCHTCKAQGSSRESLAAFVAAARAKGPTP